VRYAVVTGASKGIGRAVAEKLLEKGFHVIGNYAADDVAAAFLRGLGTEVHQLSLIKHEVFSYENACSFAEYVRGVTGAVEVLVLNSGTTDVTPFGSITKEGWMRVMDVNLNAPFFLLQWLSGSMTENAGRILLIGSAMGEYPHSRSVSYGVSKAAIHTLAQYPAKVFSEKGVTVNAIAPGFVDTPWQ